MTMRIATPCAGIRQIHEQAANSPTASSASDRANSFTGLPAQRQRIHPQATVTRPYTARVAIPAGRVPGLSKQAATKAAASAISAGPHV